MGKDRPNYRTGDRTGLQERVLKTPLQRPDEDEKTGAGNYFIANYPPFSFWTPGMVRAIDDVLDGPPPAPETPLGLYFHIPFCRKRCHFCYFRVYTDKNAAEINAYIEAGLREMAMYAGRPYLGDRRADFVYFGGGTPSYLSVPQLHDLTGRMKDLFPWDQAREVAFECEPGTLNEKKLEAIREIGVTRLSLGVENFSDHILALNGRAHRAPEIEKAYRCAKALGFPQINIDLIAGMVDETEENWKACVAKAIELDPECVTIYQMEIPYNTTIYQEMQRAGKLTAPVADWPTKRQWVKYAFEEFEKAGYTVTSGTTVVKNPKEVQFVYRDGLFSGADLLAFGVASFGHLGGVHYQNNADVGPYMEAVDRGEPPIYRAYATSPEERLVREFILRFKLGRISAAYYREKFGVDVFERFGPQLDALVDEGFVTIDGDWITLSRDGLMIADRLLPAFFLPEHRDARYT